MFWKKSLVLFVCLVLVVAVMSGCASDNDVDSGPDNGSSSLPAGMVDTARYEKDGPYVIGISTQGEVNDWQRMVLHHLNYAFEELYKDEVKEIHYAHAQWDADRQIRAVEDLLVKGIDVLIINPVNDAALVEVIDKAYAQSVPVILFGAKVLTDNYVSYVDVDNPYAAYTLAEMVAEKLEGKGDVLGMLGYPGNTYTEHWWSGAVDAFEKYPEINLVGTEYASWSPVEAKEIMVTLLRAGHEFDCIFINGGNMAYGVIEAYTEVGKPLPLIVGDDWNAFLKKALEEGITNFVAMDAGWESPLLAAEIAMKTLRGEAVPREELVKVGFFTGADLEKFVKPDYRDDYYAGHKLPEAVAERIFKD